jgi:hypothetical protein
MTVSGLTIQSVLLRIAPTTPQILRIETIAEFQKKLGVTLAITWSVGTAR